MQRKIHRESHSRHHNILRRQNQSNHHQEEQVFYIGQWNEKKCDYWDVPMLKALIIENALLVGGWYPHHYPFIFISIVSLLQHSVY